MSMVLLTMSPRGVKILLPQGSRVGLYIPCKAPYFGNEVQHVTRMRLSLGSGWSGVFLTAIRG